MHRIGRVSPTLDVLDEQPIFLLIRKGLAPGQCLKARRAVTGKTIETFRIYAIASMPGYSHILALYSSFIERAQLQGRRGYALFDYLYGEHIGRKLVSVISRMPVGVDAMFFDPPYRSNNLVAHATRRSTHLANSVHSSSVAPPNGNRTSIRRTESLIEWLWPFPACAGPTSAGLGQASGSGRFSTAQAVANDELFRLTNCARIDTEFLLPVPDSAQSQHRSLQLKHITNKPDVTGTVLAVPPLLADMPTQVQGRTDLSDTAQAVPKNEPFRRKNRLGQSRQPRTSLPRPQALLVEVDTEFRDPAYGSGAFFRSLRIKPLDVVLPVSAFAQSQHRPLQLRRITNTPDVTGTALASPPLLADMPTLIRSWTDLSYNKRRDLLRAVSAARRIDAVPDPRPNPQAAVSPAIMTCAYLNTRLFRQAHAIYGIKTPGSFSNILSDLRFILHRLGRHEPPYVGAHTLRPCWRKLYRALPTTHRQIALSGFMRFCSARSIDPEVVTADTLTVFEAWLLDRTLCRDAPVRARAVASNWTWARAHVPDWPDVALKRPGMREQYVLRLEAYPASLRADVQRFLDRLACDDVDDIFPDDVVTNTSPRSGLSRALRPRTIEGRSFQIRQCLAAKVLSGCDPASITSLRQLVDPPEEAHAIMKFFVDRAGKQKTSQTRSIGEVLRQLAKYHCRLEPVAVAKIAFWAKNAAPKVKFRMSEKNMLRVLALIEPQVRRQLLDLPDVLMREAAAPELKPHDAALLALYATALSILFVFPMRRSNLAGLRVDRQLQRLNSRTGLVDHIALSASETKNAEDMVWPIPERVSNHIQTYLEGYRPHLTTPGNPYLFPQMKGMKGRSAHDLAVGLTNLVESRIGCAFNMHLVRHFAVALFLQRNRGQFEVARKLLGHSSTSYTIAVYAFLDTDAAARALDEALTHARTVPHPTRAAPSRRPSDRPSYAAEAR